MSIAASLARVHEEIAAACARAGRKPEEITLVAVTKTFPAATVREAFEAGVRDVGENRVQEILQKAPELSDLPLTWHMIGTLQTNKVRAVLPHIGLLHSLDRAALAEAIAREVERGLGREAGARAESGTDGAAGPSPIDAGAPSSPRPVRALIQVNTTGEATKSGTDPEELAALLDRVRELPQIRVEGFMTIGPLGGGETEIRRAFALLARLRDEMRARHPDLELPFLSMGMSDDFPIAIAEGATHVRIGSRIFGARIHR